MRFVLQFQIDIKQRGPEPETIFKVYCPGRYKTSPHKLKMYNNGSVSNNIRYPEICKSENFSANIAYYNEDAYFEIVNNTMVKSFYENDPKKDDYERLLVDDYTMIVYDFEILNTFIQNKKCYC